METVTHRPDRTGSWTTVLEWLGSPFHRGAVRELGEAAESGNLGQLRSLLHPGVAVVVDRGDPDDPAIRVVRGVDDASTLLAHGFARGQDIVFLERSVNSQAGLMLLRAGRPLATIAVDFSGALVSLVWVRLNPVVLRHWNTT